MIIVCLTVSQTGDFGESWRRAGIFVLFFCTWCYS